MTKEAAYKLVDDKINLLGKFIKYGHDAKSAIEDQLKDFNEQISSLRDLRRQIDEDKGN